MAHMYPAKETDLFSGDQRFLDSNGVPEGAVPASEREVYRVLSNLPEDYYIFHSAQWVYPEANGPIHYYENDFMIMHKTLGFLFLEVKGGYFYVSNGYLHQINSKTGKDKVLSEGNDPLSQAKRAKFHFGNLFDSVFPNISKRMILEPLIWFPLQSCENKVNAANGYGELDEAILYKEDLDNPEAAIRKAFDFYSQHSPHKISPTEFERLKNIYARATNLTPSVSLYREINTGIDNEFIRLTKEQASLLDYIVDQKMATIKGAAGTGKTVIAVEAARRLASQGHKVLYLCFNNMLAEHLRRNNNVENLLIDNLGSFVYQRTGSFYEDDEQRVNNLLSINADSLPFDDLIIDEAQDFYDLEIVYFKDAIKKRDGTFLCFYDENQLVLGKAEDIPEWIKESECKLLLTRNCRNTDQIAKTSFNVIDAEIKARYSGIGGEQPVTSFCEGDLKSGIYRLIKSFMPRYSPDDITIVSLRKEGASFLSGTKNLFGLKLSEKPEAGSILLTTAKKYKGLENRVVIITDINEKDFSDSKSKRAFYVACSRASQRLALFIDCSNQNVEKIAKLIPTGAPIAKGKILAKTQTMPFQE